MWGGPSGLDRQPQRRRADERVGVPCHVYAKVDCGSDFDSSSSMSPTCARWPSWFMEHVEGADSIVESFRFSDTARTP